MSPTSLTLMLFPRYNYAKCYSQGTIMEITIIIIVSYHVTNLTDPNVIPKEQL